MSKEPLYLIDAYGLIYRFYFAHMNRPLMNPAGKNVSALFGFARTLVTLLDTGAPAADSDRKPEDASPTSLATQKLIKPRRLAAVFDSLTPTFRHKMYPEYKATRQKTPEDLHAQVPLVQELLSALGIPALRVDGYEADDIIATLAQKCQGEGRQCYILSSDKDLLQLVGNETWELRPARTARPEGDGGLPYELVGPKEVKAEWGVNPDKVLDLLSLTGDSSDNVPGIKGVGEKTAVKLMGRYGSLDEIYNNIAGIEGAIGKKIAEGKDSAYFSKSLIKLDYEVPLPIKNIEEFSIEKLDRAAGARVLLREGIRQSARQLDPNAGAAKDAPGTASEREQDTETGGSGAVTGGANSEGDFAGADSSLTVDKALLGKGVYKTILTIKELETVLSKAKKEKLLVMDFETDSLDAWNARPIGISLAVKPKEAFYVPIAPHRGIAPGDESPAPFLEPEKVKSLLMPFFEDPSMTVLAHNAKYDYKVSRGWGVGRWQCKIWDTMVAAWVVDADRGNYSLDSLATFFFGANPIAYNSVVPKGSAFDAVPLDVARD